MFLASNFDIDNISTSSYFKSSAEYKNLEYFFKYDIESNSGFYFFKFSIYGEEIFAKIKAKLCQGFTMSCNSEYNYLLFYIEEIAKLIAIREYDLLKNDKELFISIYKNLPKNYLDIALEPFEKIKEIFKARNSFLTLQKSILDNLENSLNLDITKTSKKADIAIEIKPSYYDCYIHEDNGIVEFDNANFSLSLGYEKKYKIKNISNFLNDYDLENNVKFGKNLAIKLSKENLTERANKIVSILRKAKVDIRKVHLKNVPFIYSECETLELLETLKGSFIKMFDTLYFINEDTINVKLNLTEDDKFLVTPRLNIDQNTVLYYKNKLAVFSKFEKNVQLYSFESPAALLLYKSLKNIDFDLSYLNDLMSEDFKKILTQIAKPELSTDLKSRFSINYYISLNIQKYPIFKTKYLLDDKEISLEEIKNDFYLNSIVEAYNLALLSQDLIPEGATKDLDALNTLLISDFTKIKSYASIFLSEDIQKIRRSKLNKIKVSASRINNWLEVQTKSEEYTNEEIAKILNAYEKKKKFILLNDNFIVLDNVTELEEISNTYKNLNLSKSKGKTKVPFYYALKLDALHNENVVDINYDKGVKDVILKIKNYKNHEIKLNESIKGTLRPYQVDAVKWLMSLYSQGLSGILADDMGLGKTLEVIAFHSLLKENLPTLVVCPKSLIYNWQAEFKKWDKTTKTIVISGTKEQRTSKLKEALTKNVVFIVSYDSLRSDIDLYLDQKFKLVVLDEAQYIKNSDTQKSKAVKQIDSLCRVALTGTPIENSLNDLWSIFDFLMPSYLLSEEEFAKEYEKGFLENIEIIKSKLLAKITPFVLRRTKDEVLNDLPPKTVEIIKISLNDKQAELYNAYMQDTINTLNENPKNKLSVLSALTRLRQICVDPGSFLDNYSEIPAKYEYSLNLIKNVIENNHKVLIFSQFTSVLNRFQKLLDNQNIKSLYINGETSAIDRISICEKFNNESKEKVLLISLKAGGLGLNLPGADTIIHLDPWWNYAIEEQANDRAHRIGQTRAVTVYKLIAHDSIEEKVIELQQNKKDLYEQVIKTGENKISNLTDQDIKFILS